MQQEKWTNCVKLKSTWKSDCLVKALGIFLYSKANHLHKRGSLEKKTSAGFRWGWGICLEGNRFKTFAELWENAAGRFSECLCSNVEILSFCLEESKFWGSRLFYSGVGRIKCHRTISAWRPKVWNSLGLFASFDAIVKWWKILGACQLTVQQSLRSYCYLSAIGVVFVFIGMTGNPVNCLICLRHCLQSLFSLRFTLGRDLQVSYEIMHSWLTWSFVLNCATAPKLFQHGDNEMCSVQIGIKLWLAVLQNTWCSHWLHKYHYSQGL